MQELGKYKKLRQTKEAEANSWNKVVNRVLVEGGHEADKATFYSCLFRANLFLHKFYKINEEGKYYYDSNYTKGIYQ